MPIFFAYYGRTMFQKNGDCEIPMWWKQKVKPIKARAVAYYRHSAQDRQENSIPIQREQVRKFAAEYGIEIIKEFADHGKSGQSCLWR